jgi:signal transduction histidine kinase
MRFSGKRWLHGAGESSRKNSFLNDVTLDGLPHPAIVINKQKTIMAANRAAREMGANPGGNCGRDFCASSRAVGDNSLHSEPRETGLAQLETAESFCLAEKALSLKQVRGRNEVPLFNRFWDVWWVPISDDLLLHYWVDITDRKGAEELLARSERIKALGEMALGMAHNFNNTLQVIVAGARLGLLEAGSGNLCEVQNCLQKILSIALVGAGTLKSLIDFGRQSQDLPSGGTKVFDLSKTIARTVSLCDSYWKAGEEDQTTNVSLELDLADDCLIKGNETEMFEVIMNMIKNSAEALPQGGKITVATFVQNDRAILEVSDTGVGIPEEQLTKVFEPFWTTKGLAGHGRGTCCLSRHCSPPRG